MPLAVFLKIEYEKSQTFSFTVVQHHVDECCSSDSADKSAYRLCHNGSESTCIG